MTIDIDQELSLWRSHIINKGNLGGVEYNSEHYKRLVQVGPNCLPEVFSAYGQETDIHVLYYYAGLIRRIAQFNFFKYSQKSLIKNGYELHCTKDIPFLNTLLGEDGFSALPQNQDIIVKRDKLIQWWKQRESFLQRDGDINKIRVVTGNTRQDFLGYDKTKARQFFKLHVYGIFNVPYYIDIIDQNNNPIVFCDLLRMVHYEAYKDLPATSDVVSNTWKADTKYPTRESKIKLICDWWNKANETYTRLNSLYSAIDSRVKKLC